MSIDINHVTLSGRLAKDVEVRYGAHGDTYLCFTLAVNDRIRDKETREWVEIPAYYSCIWWHKSAENIAQHLKEDTKVALEGKLKTYQFSDKRGRSHTKIDIVVQNLQFVSEPVE